MATHRILAHTLHEHEAALANQVIRGGESTDGFVVGLVDDAGLDALRKAGLVIEMLDRPRLEPIRRPVTPPGMLPEEARQAIRVRRAILANQWKPVDPAVPVQFRVLLAGPLLASWRTALESKGARVLSALADRELLVLMPPARVPEIEKALPFVERIEPASAGEELEDEVAVTAKAPPGAPELETWDLLVVDEAVRPFVVGWLRDCQVPVVAETRNKIRFLAAPGSSTVKDVSARRDWVESVEAWVPPRLCNELARVQLGVNQFSAGLGIGLDGSGGTGGCGRYRH